MSRTLRSAPTNATSSAAQVAAMLAAMRRGEGPTAATATSTPAAGPTSPGAAAPGATAAGGTPLGAGSPGPPQPAQAGTDREDYEINPSGGSVTVPLGSRWKRIGGFQLIFQLDGNLVIYDEQRQPVWAAGTHNRDAARLVMQDDGNLVIYTQAGAAIWASDTSGVADAVLTMQPNGVLAIRVASQPADAPPRWASHDPG